MNLLPPDALAQLRGAIADSGLASTTLTYYLLSAGVEGAAQTTPASLISDDRSEEFDERSRRMMLVRRVVYKPVPVGGGAAPAIRLGDRFVHDGQSFRIIETGGVDNPRWVGVYKPTLKGQPKDGFAAEGNH